MKRRLTLAIAATTLAVMGLTGCGPGESRQRASGVTGTGAAAIDEAGAPASNPPVQRAPANNPPENNPPANKPPANKPPVAQPPPNKVAKPMLRVQFSTSGPANNISVSVRSSPAGIDCTGTEAQTCTSEFTLGTTVTLRGTIAHLPPRKSSEHGVNWSGCDQVPELGKCVVYVDKNRAITVVFAFTK